MKLLFDHNLSPRLVPRLADLFPDSDHVFPLNLDRTDDPVIWEFAQRRGFAIVSKDSDFSDRSLLFGHPPKVIRLHLGNCSTATVESLLRDHTELIHAFNQDPERSCLHLPPHDWYYEY